MPLQLFVKKTASRCEKNGTGSIKIFQKLDRSIIFCGATPSHRDIAQDTETEKPIGLIEFGGRGAWNLFHYLASRCQPRFFNQPHPPQKTPNGMENCDGNKNYLWLTLQQSAL